MIFQKKVSDLVACNTLTKHFRSIAELLSLSIFKINAEARLNKFFFYTPHRVQSF